MLYCTVTFLKMVCHIWNNFVKLYNFVNTDSCNLTSYCAHIIMHNYLCFKCSTLSCVSVSTILDDSLKVLYHDTRHFKILNLKEMWYGKESVKNIILCWSSLLVLCKELIMFQYLVRNKLLSLDYCVNDWLCKYWLFINYLYSSYIGSKL